MLPERIRRRIEAGSNDEKCVLDGSDAWSCLNEIERLQQERDKLRHLVIDLWDWLKPEPRMSGESIIAGPRRVPPALAARIAALSEES